jgi:hypothetical protein
MAWCTVKEKAQGKLYLYLLKGRDMAVWSGFKWLWTRISGGFL